MGMVAAIGATVVIALDVRAQPADAASKALFDQAFAQRRRTTVQQIALPTTLDGRELGSVDAQIRPDGVWLLREALLKALKNSLNPEVYAALASAEPAGAWVSADRMKSLGIVAAYSAQSITLELKVPLDLRQTRFLRVDGRGSSDLKKPAEEILQPETWSLIANTRW
jgi:hypothetical protein